MTRLRTASPYVLAVVLAGAGALHFVKPAPYESIIPSFLPAKRALVYASGLAELACAAAVAVPRTRATGALATSVLFVAVFPANVQMAVDPGGLPRLLALLRLPLQVPLVLWSQSVGRDAGGRRTWPLRPR